MNNYVIYRDKERLDSHMNEFWPGGERGNYLGARLMLELELLLVK